MTQRNTQRGDAMAIGMIVLAIALVAAVGFIAWQNFGKKDDDKKVAETTQDAKKDDKKPATEEKKEAVLPVASPGKYKIIFSDREEEEGKTIRARWARPTSARSTRS